MESPLVKLDDFGVAFDIISSFLDSDETMDKEDWPLVNEFLSEYVYDVWIKTDPTFDKKIWTMEHGNFKDRTNNHLECLHRASS